MGVQLREGNPFYGRTIKGLRLARKKLANEKLQVNRFSWIVVEELFEQFVDGNIHPQFLADFADQAFLKRFTQLTLAAGKFPQAAEMRLCMTLGDQQLAAM